MRVVFAIDSFKGSIGSLAAGKAAARGFKEVFPDMTADVCPIADGGEGTVDAIVYGSGGEYRETTVSDPLGRPLSVRYGLLRDGTAVMEMSAAAGITLLEGDELNPMITDTYGVGEMIVDALDRGARKIIMGIGGSATNDVGTGMLRALGCRFLDANGNEIGRGVEMLSGLERIDISGMDPRLSECEFLVASDVRNPLCGENGATYIYGAQKGLSQSDFTSVDSILMRVADKTAEVIPSAVPTTEGAGAAGGLGFALIYYLGARLVPGIDLVASVQRLEEKIAECDCVITGEGRIDSQSAMGKVISGIAKIAKKYGKPVIALGGSVGDGAEKLYDVGINAVFPIVQSPCTLEYAMNENNALQNLRKTARNVAKIIESTRYMK